MAQFDHRGSVAQGAILGVIFAFFWRFRLFQIAVLGAITYFCGLFLYSQLIEQSKAPLGSYTMELAVEKKPDLHFSRLNPKYVVDVDFENKGKLLIRRWVLQSNLYHCPGESSPIEQCDLLQEKGSWVTSPTRPGESVRSRVDLTFFDVQAPEGNLRVLYSAGAAIADRDSDVGIRDETMVTPPSNTN